MKTALEIRPIGSTIVARGFQPLDECSFCSFARRANECISFHYRCHYFSRSNSNNKAQSITPPARHQSPSLASARLVIEHGDSCNVSTIAHTPSPNRPTRSTAAIPFCAKKKFHFQKPRSNTRHPRIPLAPRKSAAIRTPFPHPATTHMRRLRQFRSPRKSISHSTAPTSPTLSQSPTPKSWCLGVFVVISTNRQSETVIRFGRSSPPRWPTNRKSQSAPTQWVDNRQSTPFRRFGFRL